MDNYYKILQVADFAEIEVVRAAYKAMTKLYHPDVNKTADPSKMVQINLAYEVLGDPEKKASYDRELKRNGYSQSAHENMSSSSCKSHEDVSYSKEFKYKREESPVFKSKFANTMYSAAKFVGQAFVNSMNQYQKDYENAYFESSELSNERLVKLYLNSIGAKRNGYAQALVERGLLYREDGKLVPSYTFKQIARR